MKNIIKTVLGVIIVALNFYACDEEASGIKDAEILNRDALKQIGKLHNDILKTSFYEFDYLSKSKEALIIQKINNNTLVKLPENEKKEAIALGSDYAGQFLLESNDRTSFFKEGIKNSKLVQLIELAEGNLYKELHCNAISSNLDTLIEDVYAVNAKPKEKNAALVYLEVLKNSMHFWMPKERGGEGQGYKIIENLNGAKKEITCVEAIGAAAGAACLSYGISAFFGPVGAAALAVSITVASATASGLAAGSHPGCKKK